MYKVFFYEKTILLTDKAYKNYQGKSDVVYNLNDLKNFESVVMEFLSDKHHNRAIFCYKDRDLLVKNFFKIFYPVTAAGGLVENDKGQFLFIYRKKKWDLPKGHVDKNETVKKAAIREVLEETGLYKVEIIQPIKPTYHIYYRNNRYHLKTTHWYHMSAPGDQELKAETEEEIEEVRWVKKEEAFEYAKKSYKSIEELVAYFFFEKAS